MSNPFNLPVSELKKKAVKIRKHVLEMTTKASSGHPGGSLSAADFVVALYFNKMDYDLKNSKNPDRDRFILSKGHCAPLLYACLAEVGWFPVSELSTLRKVGSRLQGHPHYGELPGIEISTGSLGMGLSVANGIALSGKLDKKNFKVFVVLGDGELQEGNVWEAAMTSAHYKLDNVIAIVDYNDLQIDGKVSQIKDVMPLKSKWESFGWNVVPVCGHVFEEILEGIDKAKKCTGKPTVILASTVKGKCVSFMENVCDYHGKALTQEELAKALDELDRVLT